MKLVCEKRDFLPIWETCEKCAGNTGKMNIFATILFTADEEGLSMKATDIRTGITCRVEGAEVLEPGSVAVPTERVGDLFRKSDGKFTLEEKDGKITMTCGRSRYHFSSYKTEDFPELPTSDDAETFCVIRASDLVKGLRKGSICAQQKQEFPLYLSSVYLDLKGGGLSFVSTDKRRMAVARTTPEEFSNKEYGVMLPARATNYLASVLDKLKDVDTPVTIKNSEAQAFFAMPSIEFSIRKAEPKFPAYETKIPSEYKTKLKFNTAELTTALERIGIVVRDYNQTVIFDVDEKECVCWGRSQEFGEAKEIVQAEIMGETPLRVGFAVHYVTQTLKVIEDEFVTIELNGAEGHGVMRSSAKPDEFLGMIAPMDLPEEEKAGAMEVQSAEEALA
jgi:DNA polymerase-3 subunit beta